MVATKQGDAPTHEEILDFVRKTENTITESGRRFSEAVCDLVPGDGQGIRRVVDEAFDFAEKILKSQREFASSLLDNVLSEPSHKRAAAKPATKRTTHKTTKRATAA